MSAGDETDEHEPSGPTTIDSVVRDAARMPSAEPGAGVGTVLADTYELRERLGTGGMATVYRAYDRRLGRDVAVKVPRADAAGTAARAQLLRMFEREARATAQLVHPGIVTLHHVGDHEGAPFLVLELLTGETLAARLARRGSLPASDAAQILDAVLAALAYAHDRGVVHRDLTPRNVFLTADERVKVLDFGVAIDSEVVPGAVTRAAGTPGYMAPEHADADADARTDLWAAGVLFLECVTGTRPAPSVDGEPPRLPPIPADLIAPVRDVIARAIDRDPARRPTTAADMRAALSPILTPLKPRPRRRRWLVPAALAIVAAAAAIAFALTRAGTSGPPVPRDGRWRGDPPAGSPWETRLRRLDADHFAYENFNTIDGHRLTGTLTRSLMQDGTWVLSGKTAQVKNCPGCTDVGFIEFIVLDDEHLYQNRAFAGKSHDNYTTSYPPYRYKWESEITTRDYEAPP